MFLMHILGGPYMKNFNALNLFAIEMLHYCFFTAGLGESLLNKLSYKNLEHF